MSEFVREVLVVLDLRTILLNDLSGPAFQPARWDPEAFAAGARSCQAECDAVGECDGPEKALTVAGLGALLFALYRTLTRTRGE